MKIDVQPRIYVAGHREMLGSAIVRHSIGSGIDVQNIITRTCEELDLTSQNDVRNFFEATKPDQVYLAAAKVGSIHANNTWPVDFIYSNLMIDANVIESAFRSGVKKLLFLGSSCIYPRLAAQPMTESALLTGPLEPKMSPMPLPK
jgi:GDP-L-fucose synthase